MSPPLSHRINVSTDSEELPKLDPLACDINYFDTFLEHKPLPCTQIHLYISHPQRKLLADTNLLCILSRTNNLRRWYIKAFRTVHQHIVLLSHNRWPFHT